MLGTWSTCTNLNNFPLLNIQNVLTLQNTWFGCTSLSSFPLIGTSSVNNFSGTWSTCTNLNTIPLLNLSNGTNFTETFKDSGITHLPILNTTLGERFISTFQGCLSLSCLSGIDTTSQTNTSQMFSGTPSLAKPDAVEKTSITNGTLWVNNTSCPGVPPGAVIDLVGTTTETDQITFTWSSPSGSPSPTFELYGNGAIITTLPAGSSSYVWLVGPGVYNDITIKAQNYAGSATSTPISAESLSAGSPQGWYVLDASLNPNSLDEAAVRQAIIDAFGPNAVPLDWTDLQTEYNNNGGSALKSKLLNTGNAQLYGGVTRNGVWTNTATRAYFVEEDGKVTNPSFSVHDIIGPNEGTQGGSLLDLGSWDNTRPYYVKVP